MLPPLPKHALRLVRERLLGEDGFMHIRRQTFQVELESGEVTREFDYDTAGRERLDAVIVAAHFRDTTGDRSVFLRSCLRPSVTNRPPAIRPVPEKATLGGLWELPAGLVEADERTPEGLRRCAARELGEELGLTVDASALRPLGPPSFPAPGMCGERHFYFHVEVDPTTRSRPTEDGSPLERDGLIAAIRLADALALARKGELEDAKTELGLRRLAELE